MNDQFRDMMITIIEDTLMYVLFKSGGFHLKPNSNDGRGDLPRGGRIKSKGKMVRGFGQHTFNSQLASWEPLGASVETCQLVQRGWHLGESVEICQHVSLY